MRKIILFIAAALVMSTTVSAKSVAKGKAEKDTQSFRYEINCAGNGAAGTYLVEVTSYSKKKEVALDQCRKNAVHGVVFKGYGSTSDCVGQRAMAKAGAELEFKEYFHSFFGEGGECLKYASIVGSPDISKVGKEWKATAVVSVNKDSLRKALEQAGVIRGLSSGF